MPSIFYALIILLNKLIMLLKYQGYFLLIFLLLIARSIAFPNYAKLGCNDTCGNLTIPYPFGIGASCSINKWYTVICNSSTPYLRALNHLEILGIDIENHVVIVNTPTVTDCQNPIRNSIDLSRSPFLFSKSENKLVVEGCGTAAVMDHGHVLSGCSTICRNDTRGDQNNYFGISRCKTGIPHFLKSYSINLTTLERHDGDGTCGSAVLVDENSYIKRIFSSQPNIVGDDSFVPMSLLWTLSEIDLDHVTCCRNRTAERRKVDLGNGNSMDTWQCYYVWQLEGTPYLIDGCDVTVKAREDCAKCEDSGGFCYTDVLYNVEDGSDYQRNFTCYYPQNHDTKSSSGVILGVSVSVGVLFVVVTTNVLYKVIKKTKEKRQRKRFFKRNGGLLFKQQEEADPSLVDKTILFTSHELNKATDNFNENRILGRGGQGTVYKGMLVDGRIVAVKKSKIVDESQLEQFINEVVILSQVNHRNVVKLLGCCLETEVPLLVSEFISNGTLFDCIHNKTDEFPIYWNMRLQIATEVAGALAYLHSATSIPIYHRDIKTTNVLLDDKYRAKVSDFGTSRFVAIDQTHLSTLVKGTFGYIDPEYFQSSQFTEKSDVYSFGVVLIELLTGERPISLTRFGENRSLVNHFMFAMKEGRVMSIFDEMVINEGLMDELLLVANLAMRCLYLNGKSRPTMKEVAIELETIRMSHVPSMVETNIGPMMYEEEFSTLSYDDS